MVTRTRSMGERWTTWLLALGIVAVGVGAQARDARADDGPAAAPPNDEAAMAEARKHFQAGVNLLDDPDGARYEEAYHAFKKAFALSRSPKVLGNIGFCSLKLERDGEAIDAYTSYLREARDVDPQERSQIERDLATLSSSLATFKASVRRPAGAFVLIDTRLQTRGAPIVNAYPFDGSETTVRIRPGRHSFKITAADGESIAYELSVEPGARASYALAFPPPTASGDRSPRDPSRTAPSYTGPLLVGFVGLGALGAGTVTGIMARSKTDELESRCPGGICPASFDLRSTRTEAKTLGTIADIGLVSGGVLVGGAVLWALLIPSGRALKNPRQGIAPAPPPRPVAWTPGAQCGPRGCSVQIGGAF